MPYHAEINQLAAHLLRTYFPGYDARSAQPIQPKAVIPMAGATDETDKIWTVIREMVRDAKSDREADRAEALAFRAEVTRSLAVITTELRLDGVAQLREDVDDLLTWKAQQDGRGKLLGALLGAGLTILAFFKWLGGLVVHVGGVKH